MLRPWPRRFNESMNGWRLTPVARAANAVPVQKTPRIHYQRGPTKTDDGVKESILAVIRVVGQNDQSVRSTGRREQVVMDPPSHLGQVSRGNGRVVEPNLRNN